MSKSPAKAEIGRREAQEGSKIDEPGVLFKKRPRTLFTRFPEIWYY